MKRCWMLWGCAGLLACAGPVQQAPARAPKPAVLATGSSNEFTERGTFADVALPPNVLMWARVPAPTRDIPVLGQLLGMGASLDPSNLLADRLGATLSHAIDLARPVDVLVSGFDDSPGGVIACGVNGAGSFAAQVQADFQLIHLKPGRWRLKAKRSDADLSVSCELWNGAEPVGARLICGYSAALVEEQGPYLMAAQRSAVDRASLHAEMPGSALAFAVKKGAQTQASKVEPNSDESERQAREMGLAWFNALIGEVSGLSWDVTLNDASVDVAQELRFLKAESPLSVGIAGRIGPVQAVPEAFWRLPADSSLSLYSEGSEPEPTRQIAAMLAHQMMTSATADDEVPASELARVEQALENLIMRGQAWEFSYGQDLEQSSDALEEAAKKLTASGPHSGSADPALKRAQAKLGGWGLVGLEDDSHAFLEALRNAVRIANEKTHFPRRKGAKPKEPSSSNEDFSIVPLKNSSGLPQNALHLVVTSRPNPKYVAPSDGTKPAPVPTTLHLIAAPGDARQVWLAFARDEAVATSRLRTVLSPDKTKTLAANEGLRQLAKSPLAGLGFGTIAGFAALDLSANSVKEVAESRAQLSHLWALANKGETQIPIWVTRKNGAGTARSITIHARLQPNAVADLLQLVIGAASEHE